MCATNNFQDFVKENFYSGKKHLRVSNDRREWIANFEFEMDRCIKKSGTKRRGRRKKIHLHSSIFHETTFSILAIENENWNCLLKKMRPIRPSPVNLSQPRSRVITAYCSNRRPITRTYTRHCENTRDTFKFERGTEGWRWEKTIQS